jgi:hypothetical protein
VGPVNDVAGPLFNRRKMDGFEDEYEVDDFDRDQYAGLSDADIRRVKQARDEWELAQIRERLDAANGASTK